MSETELQDWLYDKSLRSELQQLGMVTALLELDNVVQEPRLAEVKFDWPRLLLGASILARSNKRLHREAYVDTPFVKSFLNACRIRLGACICPAS